jgi:hypothetical protein
MCVFSGLAKERNGRVQVGAGVKMVVNGIVALVNAMAGAIVSLTGSKPVDKGIERKESGTELPQNHLMKATSSLPDASLSVVRWPRSRNRVGG